MGRVVVSAVRQGSGEKTPPAFSLVEQRVLAFSSSFVGSEPCVMHHATLVSFCLLPPACSCWVRPANRKERGLLDPAKRDPNERYCSLGDKLAEMGRYGQKTGVRVCFSCEPFDWRQPRLAWLGG